MSCYIFRQHINCPPLNRNVPYSAKNNIPTVEVAAFQDTETINPKSCALMYTCACIHRHTDTPGGGGETERAVLQWVSSNNTAMANFCNIPIAHIWRSCTSSITTGKVMQSETAACELVPVHGREATLSPGWLQSDYTGRQLARAVVVCVKVGHPSTAAIHDQNNRGATSLTTVAL